MLSNILTLCLLAALSVAEPKPYRLGKVYLNDAFGVIDKRQAGYAPTQTYCNTGDTCAVACGPTYIQCVSHPNTGFAQNFNKDRTLLTGIFTVTILRFNKHAAQMGPATPVTQATTAQATPLAEPGAVPMYVYFRETLYSSLVFLSPTKTNKPQGPLPHRLRSSILLNRSSLLRTSNLHHRTIYHSFIFSCFRHRYANHIHFHHHYHHRIYTQH